MRKLLPVVMFFCWLAGAAFADAPLANEEAVRLRRLFDDEHDPIVKPQTAVRSASARRIVLRRHALLGEVRVHVQVSKVEGH